MTRMSFYKTSSFLFCKENIEEVFDASKPMIIEEKDVYGPRNTFVCRMILSVLKYIG